MKKFFIILLTCSMIGILNAGDTAKKVIPTMLKVTVLDYLGNPVEGAEVVLYETATDYEKEINVVQKIKSNSKGKAFFKGLKPMAYYIQVTEGNRSNIGAGEKTEELLEARINKANIVIE